MKVVLLMMVVVLLMLSCASLTLARMPKMPANMPPCVAKLSKCSNNAMESTDFSTGEVPCCSEWAQEIKDNTQCVCDNFKPYLTSLTDFFTLCKIDAPTCPAGGSKTSNSEKGSDASAMSSKTNVGASNTASTVGLLPILLLVLTIIVKF